MTRRADHQEVGEGHGGDGDDDGEVGDEVSDGRRKEILGPELLEVVGQQEGAQEEKDAEEEGVGDVVAARGLHPVNQRVVDGEL